MSRETLAERAGISEEYVGQLERDRKTPSIQTLWDVLKVLEADAYRMSEAFALAGYGDFWEAVTEAAKIVHAGVPSIDAFVDNTRELRTPEARVTARTVLKALSEQKPVSEQGEATGLEEVERERGAR